MPITDIQYKKRLSKCRACPSLIRPTWNCGECGCFVKVKGKLKGMKCPLGKWEAIATTPKKKKKKKDKGWLSW